MKTRHCENCKYLETLHWSYRNDTWLSYFCGHSYECNLANDIAPTKVACEYFMEKENTDED